MHLCNGRQAGLNKGLAGSGTQRVPGECLKTHKREGLGRAQRSEVAPGNTAHGTQQVGRVSEGLASGPTHWEWSSPSPSLWTDDGG